MPGFRIEGDLSGNVAEVNSNKELLVALTQTDINAGYAVMMGEPDTGTVTGSRIVRALDLTNDYRLRSGLDTLLFNEWFPGSALNSAIWTAVVSTMTVTVAGGFVNLNAGLATASGNVARVQSYRSFPIFGTFGVFVEFLLQFPQLPVANNVCEWGLGIAATIATPTDGCFFRLNAAGEFRCVVNFNGTENQSEPLDFATLVGASKTKHFIVNIGEDIAEFWINDVIVATIPRPAGVAAMTASNNLPILMRNYNANVTSVAQVMKCGMVNVTLADMNSSKLWTHIMAGGGGGAYQGQTGGTMGSTALISNNANPTAATPTNTTAALTAGLGGVHIANITGLAVTTDYIISSYQVPAGTAAIPGKSLYVTGLKFNSVNMGAINATTPLTYAIFACFGHTAVTLATTESATAKAPRRIALGVQSLAVNAAIGIPASPEIAWSFQSPLVVQPGEFIAIVLRFITYTSTTSQALWCYTTVEGYFE